MKRVFSIWRAWSVRRRVLVATGVVALVAAGAGLAAYLVLKRPGDVSNPDIEFVQHDKPGKKIAKTTDWPVYGLNDQRTRYLPADNVKPPYHQIWAKPSDQLLEFSPVLVGHRLYIINKLAEISAINDKDGKRVWERDLGSLNASSPAYAKGRLYAVSLDPGQVVAMNPKQGKVIWTHALPGRSETSPVVYNNKVIVGSESGDVFALNDKDGSVVWSIHTAGAVKGGVALDRGTAFFGNYAGQFYAVNASTGAIKWQSQAEGLSFGRDGSFYSTPAVAFGRVYAASKDSRVYSFAEDTGQIAWSHSTGAEIYAAPAVADTPGAPPAVYIGSLDHHFYALDARSGAELWNQNVGGPILGAASVVGRVVYVSVIGPNIGTFGYNAKTGDKVFYDTVGEYNPVVSDGQKIYLTGAGAIKALEPAKGLKKGEARKRKGPDNSKKQRAQDHHKPQGKRPPKKSD